MSNEHAELLLPALRWNSVAKAYECEGVSLERALALGVGGFCLFGGSASDARAMTTRLRAESRVPLLIAADIERGAGQQFAGLTPLPPFAALGALGDADVMRRAGRLTALEARSIGVSWVFAPVVDLDVEPSSPVIGSRSLGAKPDEVARLAQAWIEGCQQERVLACAKHFPGQGRVTEDPNLTLPSVALERDELIATDLVPFKAVIQGGVASIMTAHVAYGAFDPEGLPATLSRRMVLGMLRRELGFKGLVVSDWLVMHSVQETEGAIGGAARALNAGCDVLLYPPDVSQLYDALTASLERGVLAAEHVRQSCERRRQWTAWAEAGPPETVGEPERAWAAELCRRVITLVRGRVPPLSGPIEIVIPRGDDTSMESFVEQLREAGLSPRVADAPSADARGTLVVALAAPAGSEDIESLTASAARQGRETVVVAFMHQRKAHELQAPNVVCAWASDAGMQRAAAEWLVTR